MGSKPNIRQGLDYWITEYQLIPHKLGNVITTIYKAGSYVLLINDEIKVFGGYHSNDGSRLETFIAKITNKQMFFEDLLGSPIFARPLYLQIQRFRGWEDAKLNPDLPEILKEYIIGKERKKI